MPNRPLQFCNHHGCPTLTASRFCPEHQAIYDQETAGKQSRYNRERGSAAKQGYDSDWIAVRNIYIRRHPLCEDCMLKGKITAAEMVHHVRSVKDYPGARLDMQNLRALCNVCHEKIEGPNRFRRREPT